MSGAFTREHALAMGYSAADTRRLVRSGRWIVLRRGVYATAETVASAKSDPVQLHALQSAAVLLALSAPYVVAASSAARLYGMKFLNRPTDEVVLLTSYPVVHGLRRDGYLLRQAPLPPEHVRVLGDLPITSPARTLLDLACELPFADSVALTDFSLHERLVLQAELEDLLGAAEGRPGIETARQSFRFADNRAESPLESASRVALHLGGVPAPELQVEFDLPGRRDARVDFFWPGLVGEADGDSKYEPTDGRTPLQVIRDEREREFALRDRGLDVVRWGWVDLHRGRVVPRVLAALERVAERNRGRAS
ncbi:MAG TPA: type IV toxin-antitoxin system AbiEi family antitoxin domain-containing protein [Sporichthyaceae bacterium]